MLHRILSATANVDADCVTDREVRPFFCFMALLTRSECVLLLLVLGIVATLIFPQLPPLWLLGLISLPIMLLTFRFSLAWVAVVFVFGLAWAVWHFSEHGEAILPTTYERVDFDVIGRVIGLPTKSDQAIKFRFQVESTHAPLLESSLPARRIQLSCYRCPHRIEADQRWQFTVRLKRPHSYASWGAFDYQKYLFRHKIVAHGYVRQPERAERLAPDLTTIHGWRQNLKDELESRLKEGAGRAMILALALGDKSGFSTHDRKVLQTTGVSHLMAISGLHVGLVFVFSGQLFRWLLWPAARVYLYVPRQTLVLVPALAFAVLYASLAGFSVSTQRALIMLLVYVLCRLLARGLSLAQVLLRAMVVLLLLDPFAILDTGFWLSCGAVWVISLSNYVQSSASLLRLQPKLWLGMLPMTSLFFGQVSLVSPLVNVLLVPLFCLLLIPLTLLGVGFLLIGFDVPSDALLHSLSYGFTEIFKLLERIAQLRFSHWYTQPIEWWHWVFAGLVTLAIYQRSWMTPWLIIVLTSLVLFRPIPQSSADALRLVLLDVGQGLSMVVETNGQVLVYDVGPRYHSGFSTAKAVLLPYLRSRGVRSIDTLIISHADMDHIGGLADLRGAFAVRQTYTSRVDKVSHADACQAGMVWSMGQTRFRFVSPDEHTPNGSNNRSCVLMIEHAGVRLLLTGDIEKQVERYLVRSDAEDLRANILLVPHQGSKTSSTPEFIDAVQPSLALIAAGYRNHYGHPHADVTQRYSERGIKILSTIQDGSIAIDVDQQGWRVSRYRDLNQRFWHYQKVSYQGG